MAEAGAQGAEGLAAGEAEGGASAFSRSWLGRSWLGQALRWLGQGGAIFATTKGRVIMTLLCCAIAALNHWLFKEAAAAQAAGGPKLAAPALFNGGRAHGPAWQEPDLWNTDLSKTPNSVALVDGKYMDAAARAAAAAKAAADAEAARKAAEAGGPGATGDAKDAGGDTLPGGVGLPGGPKDGDARNNLKTALGQMKPWQPTGGSVGSSTALFGGVGRAFASIKTLAMRPFSGQAQTGRAAASRSATPRGHAVGPARRALDQAFGFGKVARTTGDLGTAATVNGVVFDNAALPDQAITGSGSAIQGSGIPPGQGSKGDEYQSGGPVGSGSSPGSSTSGANANSNGNSNTDNDGGGGGANNNNTTDPQATCDAQFPDGGYMATPEGGCAPPASATNATPWQGQSDMAMMLTMIAGIVLLIAELLSKTVWGKPFAFWLASIAAVIGAFVVFLGVSLMGQGQQSQGMIYTLTGAMITAAGIMCAMGQDKAGAPSSTAASSSTNAQAPLKGLSKI